MSEFTDVLEEIPDATWYVVTQDIFMSNWGPAEDRENIVVTMHDTLDSAFFTADYAATRDDTSDVSVVAGRTGLERYLAGHEPWLASLLTREDARAWYYHEEEMT